MLLSKGRPQPISGSVFVTGCDSGMGEITSMDLAKKGYVDHTTLREVLESAAFVCSRSCQSVPSPFAKRQQSIRAKVAAETSQWQIPTWVLCNNSQW
jgi:hypothetical protein